MSAKRAHPAPRTPEPAASVAVAGLEHAVDRPDTGWRGRAAAAHPPCAPPRQRRRSGRVTRTMRSSAPDRPEPQRRREPLLAASSARNAARGRTAPRSLPSRKPVQALGRLSRRSVWPVGAVSKTTWSKPVRVVGEQPGELVEGGDLGGAGARELLAHRRQLLVGCWPRASAPAPAGGRPRPRPPGRCSSPKARHARHRPRLSASSTPSISSRLDAGSVLTSSTRRPASASAIADGAGERRLADAALAGEEQDSAVASIAGQGHALSTIAHLRSSRQSAMPCPPPMHMRDDAALDPVALHGVQQARGQHRAGRADRMTMSDRAAFDVDDVLGQSKVLHARRLRSRRTPR